MHLFCPLRKKWVVALPEEKIRQALIKKMTESLGYPLNYLALEKSLNGLPHLQFSSALPKRRADLIVFSQGTGPNFSLYPLLLIECKATSLTNKVLRQLVGYNRFIGAHFIAAINEMQSIIGHFEEKNKNYVFSEGLPSYPLLIEKAQLKKSI